MIKAVILDLDDTLYAFEPLHDEAMEQVCDYACKELGITAQQFEEAYAFGKSETKRLLGDVASSHNRVLYCQKALEYLGVSVVPMSLQMYDIYWGTILEKMRLRDGVREFLSRMHEHGVKVLICTDLTVHIQHRKIRTLGIEDDIDYLVTSEEAGREKPSLEIFTFCLTKLGLPAEEVCCIGDSPVRDVEGARAAGIHAILYQADKPSAEQFADMAEMILSDNFPANDN